MFNPKGFITDGNLGGTLKWFQYCSKIIEMLFLCSAYFKIKSCTFYYPCFLIFTTIGIWESHRAVCHSTEEKKSLGWPCMGRFPENHISVIENTLKGAPCGSAHWEPRHRTISVQQPPQGLIAGDPPLQLVGDSTL